MLNLSAATRVFVATAPVDLRASFNRLFALTQSVLEQDPLSGHWFVFTNRQPVRARRQASAPGSKFFSGTAPACGVAPNGWSVVASPGPRWNRRAEWWLRSSINSSRRTGGGATGETTLRPLLRTPARGLIPVGCWAHARRKLVEAAALGSAEATAVVTEIRKLYLIEARARDECLRPEQRWELRQQRAAPIVAALPPKLEQLREAHLPQSPLGKAVRYALNEWGPLTRYLEGGRLEIDNNLTENAIRPSAVGKKNWLFIGPPKAG